MDAEPKVGDKLYQIVCNDGPFELEVKKVNSSKGTMVVKRAASPYTDEYQLNQLDVSIFWTAEEAATANLNLYERQLAHLNVAVQKAQAMVRSCQVEKTE